MAKQKPDPQSESELDSARISAIREAFADSPFDGCRDHCIVQGLSVDMAAAAAADLKAGLGWRSPAGGVFGRDPDAPAKPDAPVSVRREPPKSAPPAEKQPVPTP